MSISAAAQQFVSREAAFIAAYTAAALAAMGLAGLFRRASVHGPDRIPRDESAQPIFLMMVIAVLIFLSADLALQSVRNSQARAEGRKPPTKIEEMSPRELVLASSVPPAVTLLGILVAYRATFRGQYLQWIGFKIRRLPAGLIAGAVAIFCAWPLVFWASNLAEWFYQQIGYKHPSEHDLLRVFRSPDQTVRLLGALAAIVLVPMVEEFIFRGHIQTIARRLTRSPWLAVLIASVLFTVAHGTWMWPPIFVLSLCIGYVYERTGNLWAAITCHMLFNASSIIQYLLMLRSGQD